MQVSPPFGVFLKPWPQPLDEVAPRIKALGFDGVELPVRPGFPVTPENVQTQLPQAVRILSDHGLQILSVASEVTEPVAAACSEARIPLIRVCIQIPAGVDYLTAEARTIEAYRRLEPILGKYGVAIGVQNHCDRWLANAASLRRLVEDFAPEHVAVVWDAAHNALNGEVPELALDLVWSHLRMVNLKNAYWRRLSPPEAEVAEWKIHWTSGRQGLASWPTVAGELARRGYGGPICFTAEYTDEAAADRLIAEDIRFARAIFNKAYHHAN